MIRKSPSNLTLAAARGNRPVKANRVNRYKGQKSRRPSRTRGVFAGLGLLTVRLGKVVFSGVFMAVLVVSMSVGLIMGYRYLLASDYFSVRKVVLSGLNRVTREEVLWRTGLDKPANILSLKLGDLAASVRDLPWVEEVTVTRKLPDTITVLVKERRAAALVSLDGLYYLDEKGVAFKKVGAGERPQMPIITGFDREDLARRHENFLADLKEVFALLEVLAERNDRFRLENVSEINYDAFRGLTMFTKEENVQVKVGLGEYRAKLRRLGRVVAHLKINGQAEGLTYFNLESSPRVVVRWADGEKTG